MELSNGHDAPRSQGRGSHTDEIADITDIAGLLDDLAIEPVVEFGRYQLLRVIGRGGMGQVFEAWDTQLERRVAIKVLTSGHCDDLAFREARCLARVAHPNVVSVHDIGQVESLVFIAMELVDGPDFGRWLRARPRRWTSVFDCLIAAGRGLVAVHEAGLVHGDVKPGNVVVGADGRVRIADFGLARVGPRVAGPELAAAVRRAAVAVLGGVGAELTEAPPEPPEGAEPRTSIPSPDPEPGGGTKPYMAPECLVGIPHDPARADQYSMCAMAWEALFGVRPYAGRCAATILGSIAAGRLERGRGRPVGMPRAIEAALLRGLSEAPEQRWPSVEALLEALESSRRLAAVPDLFRGWFRGLVGGAFGLAFASALIGTLSLLGTNSPPTAADLCTAGSGAMASDWGPEQRAALEQRPELRFAAVWLSDWTAKWSALWARACAVDDAVATCLQRQRERLGVVVGLLLEQGEQASPAIARVLLAELDQPTVCVDPALGVAAHSTGLLALAHVAEFASSEAQIEQAVLAGRRDEAASALATFEARVEHVAEGERAEEPFIAAARLRVARWQSRLLIDAGEHQRAALHLRAALARANRLGLDLLRFHLLLERVRLAQAVGDDDLDHLAALTSLAQRVEADLGAGARAELVLVESKAAQSAPQARITEALTSLDEAQLDAPLLRFELMLMRARRRAHAGQFDEALHDVDAMLAIAEERTVRDERTVWAGELVVQALLLRARIGARTGRCDLASATLERLRVTTQLRRGPEAGLHNTDVTDAITDIIRGLDSPGTPACPSTRQRAQALVTKSTATPVNHEHHEP